MSKAQRTVYECGSLRHTRSLTNSGWVVAVEDSKLIRQITDQVLVLERRHDLVGPQPRHEWQYQWPAPGRRAILFDFLRPADKAS